MLNTQKTETHPQNRKSGAVGYFPNESTTYLLINKKGTPPFTWIFPWNFSGKGGMAFKTFLSLFPMKERTAGFFAFCGQVVLGATC
jgi:hypothetical protein